MSLASIPSALAADLLSKDEGNSERTFAQKMKYVATHITVEPLVFLYSLSHVMNLLTSQNLNLEKACRVNLQYNASVCDAMVTRDQTGYEPYQEAEVQKLVSKMITINMAICGAYPTLLMLFLGSWSDRHSRRKPLILMPLIGEITSTSCLFVCAYFFMELPIEYSMLSETIPYALGGTIAGEFLGIYTYVSGLCNDNDRTMRIGAVSMFQSISGTIGVFFAGLLINVLGFKGVYGLSIFLMSLGLLYGIFKIKENDVRNNGEKDSQASGIKDFFALEHIKNTFRICFKEGPDNRRSKMIVLMFLSTMIMGPIQGEMAVGYMYSRIKCGWNEIDFSFFNSLHSVIQVCGSIFALSYFSRYLKLHDSTLGVISMVSKISACFVYAFAPSGLYFYLAACVEVFHVTCHIALRSLMAQIVPPHELGQSNSVFGIFEAVTPLVFGPLYTTLYRYTITIFPGAFYIFTAGLYMITFSLFLYMYKAHKEDERVRLRKEEANSEQKDSLLKEGLKNESVKAPTA